VIRQEEAPAGAGKGRAPSSGPGKHRVADGGVGTPLAGSGNAYDETTTVDGKKQGKDRTVRGKTVLLRNDVKEDRPFGPPSNCFIETIGNENAQIQTTLYMGRA
jgi:hypothetical protein